MNKKRQFSLAHLTIPGCSPPELIHLAARAGFDSISPRTISMRLPGEPDYGLARNKDLLKKVKVALRATGLRINDTENARIFDGVIVKDYFPEMEVAAELGIRNLLTNIWTDDKALIVDSFTELCELAEPLGISVNIEMVTWASVKTIAQCMEITAASGKKNVGIVVDTLHFNRSQCQLEALDAVPRDYFRFMHLCDAPAELPKTKEELIFTGRENRLYLGDGGIDIAAIVRRLPEVVYALEIPNLAVIDEVGRAEHVSRALETTKKYFEEHCL
jgi:sugar phosphate isomerase/epimerase